MKLSSDVAGDSNDENSFLHKFPLTNTQVLKLCKAFANNNLVNIKLSQTQLHKIGQLQGFLGRLLGLLLKAGLLFIKNVLKPLAKRILIPLELTAAACVPDPAFHKKMFGSGMATLIILNEEMNGIMKIAKFLEKSIWLIKGTTETIKNEAKDQKRGISQYVILGTLGASLLGNLWTGKATIRAGKGMIRAGQDF